MYRDIIKETQYVNSGLPLIVRGLLETVNLGGLALHISRAGHAFVLVGVQRPCARTHILTGVDIAVERR